MVLENIEIIVGTYEEFLLGYQLKDTGGTYCLTQTFANHSHTASIRCVTFCGKMMASGGADERVHLYDMDQRKESGVLMHHNGTVSCVEFSPNGSHLITGGEDGMLAIYQVGNFKMEKMWGNAHKGSGILDISVHPSSKLALTVGTDATLRTWNLVKGRRAYATRLASAKCGGGWQITGVCWSPDGKLYVVGIGSKVDVYSVDTASVIYSISAETKLSAFCFLSDNVLCAGCEEGKIYLHDLDKKCCLLEIKAHDRRVKSLASVTDDGNVCLVSASSSGEIKVWECKGKSLLEMAKINIGCRITCLTITTCGYPKHMKQEEDIIDEEKEQIDDLMNSIAGVRHSASARPITKEVVIVEDEDIAEDEDRNGSVSNVKKCKKSKNKRKKMKHPDSIPEEEGESGERPMKRQKVNGIKKSKKSKPQHQKSKEQNSSGWDVTDLS